MCKKDFFSYLALIISVSVIVMMGALITHSVMSADISIRHIKIIMEQLETDCPNLKQDIEAGKLRIKTQNDYDTFRDMCTSELRERLLNTIHKGE